MQIFKALKAIRAFLIVPAAVIAVAACANMRDRDVESGDRAPMSETASQQDIDQGSNATEQANEGMRNPRSTVWDVQGQQSTADTAGPVAQTDAQPDAQSENAPVAADSTASTREPASAGNTASEGVNLGAASSGRGR